MSVRRDAKTGLWSGIAEPSGLGRVVVLMGGRSAEREVSLMSGHGVLAALKSQGVAAEPFDPAEGDWAELGRGGFAAAFIALHGRFGEDGTVQGALELFGLPYTGSGVLASALAIDKVRSKALWLARGLATPAFVLARSMAQARSALETLGLPLVVKPCREGSSLGFSRVDTADQLGAAYELAARYDDEVLIERFIRGPELTVAILGEGDAAMALPPIEIRARGGAYDYHNKYFSDDTQYLCPAPLDDAGTARVVALALDAYRALGCEGWGRVDLMLDPERNEPWLLEVNTSPGMTSHSLVPMAARAAGLDYARLCLAILGEARLKLPVPSASERGSARARRVAS
jgi:D-alanine-D-alanine ligase